MKRSTRRTLLPGSYLLVGLALALPLGCSGDKDGDGVAADQGDCDDENAAVYPGAKEVCDQADNDCNGLVDDLGIYYPDADGDGVGSLEGETPACSKPAGFVDKSGDCDDDNPNIMPGAEEVCDDKDNDCDKDIDEDIPFETYYADLDGDGVGVESQSLSACTKPGGYTLTYGDCNDTDAEIYPKKVEECDAKDNNCDGLVDELFPPVDIYVDADGDGFGANNAPSIQACATAPGYSPVTGDCKDDDPSFNPKGVERCDGLDNDCDGTIDEDLRFRWFQDMDGDGFGAVELYSCNPPEGYVDRRGDCNDQDSGIKPGAPDLPGDKRDSDCGGTDFPEPSVGISSLSSPLIKPAIALAVEGVTIWVGPNTYPEFDVSCIGRNFTLKSTDLEESTIIDSAGAARGMWFSYSDGPGCVMDGFTVRNGQAGDGAGVLVDGGSPTLRNLIVTDNKASEYGGGIYLYESNAVLENIKVLNNQADKAAGGIYISDGAPTLSNILVAGNRAGGLDGVTDPGSGGGIVMNETTAQLSFLTVVGNVAGVGGGLEFWGAKEPKVQNSIIAYNYPDNLMVSGSGSPTVSYSVLYNRILRNHNLDFVLGTVHEEDPGFVRITNDDTIARHDYHLQPDSVAVDAATGSLKDPDGSPADMGFFGGPKADFNYYADVDADGLYDGWEYRYLLDTAKDDSLEDLDDDGLTNLEELEEGLDPSLADDDGDGAGDGEELAAGSDPTEYASSPDAPEGAVLEVPSDYVSIQDAVNHLTWSGTIRLAPGEYAENLIVSRREVTLQTMGRADETLLKAQEAQGMNLILVALKGAHLTVSGGAAETGGGICAMAGTLELTDVVFADNEASAAGGALALRYMDTRLEDATLEGNQALNGGAIFAYHGDLELIRNGFTGNEVTDKGGALLTSYTDVTVTDSHFEDNVADKGGAVFSDRGSLTMENSLIKGNRADLEYGQGGGLYLSEVAANVKKTPIRENRAVLGGGVFQTGSGQTRLSNLLITANESLDEGGGIRAQGSYNTQTLELANVRITANKSGTYGGGLSAESTILMTDNVIVDHNSAKKDGGGLYLYSTPAGSVLSGLVVASNHADGAGGGIYEDYAYDDAWNLTGSIIALNTPDNIKSFADGCLFKATYTDFYNPDGPGADCDALSDVTNRDDDPLFLDVDETLGVLDFHLSLASSLIDVGPKEITDPDGSRMDLGAYGGAGADGWDLDIDGKRDYFWPGEWSDAPEGFASTSFDCNDLDASVQSCQ